MPAECAGGAARAKEEGGCNLGGMHDEKVRIVSKEYVGACEAYLLLYRQGRHRHRTRSSPPCPASASNSQPHTRARAGDGESCEEAQAGPESPHAPGESPAVLELRRRRQQQQQLTARSQHRQLYAATSTTGARKSRVAAAAAGAQAQLCGELWFGRAGGKRVGSHVAPGAPQDREQCGMAQQGARGQHREARRCQGVVNADGEAQGRGSRVVRGCASGAGHGTPTTLVVGATAPRRVEAAALEAAAS